MTEDAISSTNPTWVPQSDFAPSLSMSALAMSPLDPNRNTLYAGSGITSHGLPLVGPRAGPLFGLLKTVNGGKDWLEIARAEFQGKASRELPRLPCKPPKGTEYWLSPNSGLHVSPDGGATWTKSAAVNGRATDVISEITSPSTVYVAAAGRVWRSDDAADNDWHDVTPPDWAGQPAWSTVRFALAFLAPRLTVSIGYTPVPTA